MVQIIIVVSTQLSILTKYLFTFYLVLCHKLQPNKYRKYPKIKLIFRLLLNNFDLRLEYSQFFLSPYKSVKYPVRSVTLSKKKVVKIRLLKQLSGVGVFLVACF